MKRNSNLFFLLACVFLVGYQSVDAQELKRKGGLGVAYYPTAVDTLITKLGYTQGAIVQFPIKNNTCDALGILRNDIITKVNNIDIKVPTDLPKAAKILRGGEDISITILRDKKEMVLTGKVIERPKEISTSADIVYGSFSYKGGLVRTIFKTPKGKPALGTIYFLQGLPCYSMDNFTDLDKTKQAIDAMVDRGYAVYRMEKGDMGDNLNTPPCEPMGFHEELEMYDAGYLNLLALPNIDKNKIFLFGHSMGGTTAPILGEKYQPRGIAIYGSGFKPWYDYLIDAYLIQGEIQGADLAQLRDKVEEYKIPMVDFFYKKKPVEEIIMDKTGLEAMQVLMSYNPKTQQSHSGRHINTFKELNEYNVAKSWGNFENDVLAIYGECDQAANNADDHIKLVEYVNKKRPGKGTFWLAPRSSHTFEELGTMEEYLQLKSSPTFLQYAAQRFNPKIFDFVIDWMNKISAIPIVSLQKTFEDFSINLPEDGATGPSMDVKAVDIDGDNDLDIILANEFKANTILINDGKGKFTNESSSRLPQVVHDSEDIVAEDLNGDGSVDLIFCSEDDMIHEYYINDGKGKFSESKYQFPKSEANAVICGDINGDKKLDIIFGNNGSNTVFINNGTGVFTLDEKALPSNNKVTQDLALVDIDNDGDLDLFEANEDGNALYLNNGKGKFTDVSKTNLPSGADMESRKVAFGDVDKDGDLDLFLANVNFKQTKDPQNRLYINNGKGLFTDVTNDRLPIDNDHTIDAIFVDLNQDGYIDIVLANVFGSPIKAYKNDGKGYFIDDTIELIGKRYTRDALGVISADLNGDKVEDLYICDRFNPAINKKDLLLINRRNK